MLVADQKKKRNYGHCKYLVRHFYSDLEPLTIIIILFPTSLNIAKIEIELKVGDFMCKLRHLSLN